MAPQSSTKPRKLRGATFDVGGKNYVHTPNTKGGEFGAISWHPLLTVSPYYWRWDPWTAWGQDFFTRTGSGEETAGFKRIYGGG